MALNWKRFVDYTIGYVKNGSIDIILPKLNSFHPNIQFTYEVEEENKLSFLDVLLIRNGNFIETKIYRKPTNNDIYLNWNLFSPNTWKRSTLKTLIKRTYLICLSKKHLVDELKHLRYVFEKHNNFPNWVIDKLLSEVQSEDSNMRSLMQDNQNDVNKTAHLLVLPYTGSKGEKLIKSMKNSLKCVLTENVTTRITYSGTRLSIKFTKIKNKTVKEHQHDIVYYVMSRKSVLRRLCWRNGTKVGRKST